MPDVVNAINCIIRARLNPRIPKHPVLGPLTRGTIRRPGYVSYLAQTLRYVSWTPRLLFVGAQRLSEIEEYRDLAQLCLVKRSEETGHDAWARSDLEALGVDSDTVQRIQRSPAVGAYIAWNRCIVASDRPLGIFGAAYVLEVLGDEWAGVASSNLRRRSRIPGISMATSFLDGHAGADPDHCAILAQRLRCVEDPEDQEAIVLSARVTCELFPDFFPV